MFSQPVRTSVCALVCVLSACSENAPASPTLNAAPKYSLDRPVEGLGRPLARDANFKRGVSLDLFVGEVDEPQRADYGVWLDQVAQLGATDLELVVQWSQVDAAALEIAPSATLTVDDEFLGWLMDQANQRQLRVLLTPVIELEQAAPGQARRALAPTDANHWFWSYHRFLLHYARIAEAHKARCFAVGADLPDSLVRDGQWPSLIKDVRKAYKSKLTFVTRPESLEAVPFWNEMDEVGLSGVGELFNASAPANPADRAKRLSALLQRTRKFRKEQGKPLFLSSVQMGLSPFDPAAVGKELRGSMAQLDAGRALYQGLQAESSIAGPYVMLARPKAPRQPLAPPVTSACAAVLKHWYARSRGPTN